MRLELCWLAIISEGVFGRLTLRFSADAFRFLQRCWNFLFLKFSADSGFISDSFAFMAAETSRRSSFNWP